MVYPRQKGDAKDRGACYNERMKRYTERGSALIYILIAVILFAALSYTVSRMISGESAQNLTKENASILASEIADTGRLMRQAVQSMRISNDCEETQISFERSPFDGSDTNYVNASAPSDFSCHIFHASGGGVNWTAPRTDWLDGSFSAQPLYGQWYFTGSTCVENMGSQSTNCHTDAIDNAELTAFLPYISLPVCQSIADKLNGGTISVDADNAWASNTAYFQGTFSEGAARHDAGNPEFQAGCFRSTGTNPASGSYTFYQVLIAR